MNDNLTTDELKSAELVLERWEQGYELHAGELVHRIEGLYAALRASDRDLATARTELAEQNADTDALLDKLMDGEGELRDTIRVAAAVTRRLLDGWMIDGQAPDEYPELWVSERTPTQYEHITDAERVWLASISLPTSGDGG